jgi:hypothetical protein
MGGQIQLAVGHQFDIAGFAAEVLHAYLDAVYHEPPESSNRRYNPRRCRVIANDDQ